MHTGAPRLTPHGEQVTSRADAPMGTRTCVLGLFKGQHMENSESSPTISAALRAQGELKASSANRSLHEPALVTRVILRVSLGCPEP